MPFDEEKRRCNISPFLMQLLLHSGEDQTSLSS
jgi:hypothetical protein